MTRSDFEKRKMSADFQNYLASLKDVQETRTADNLFMPSNQIVRNQYEKANNLGSVNYSDYQVDRYLQVRKKR
jgi:hypothetical protein